MFAKRLLSSIILWAVLLGVLFKLGPLASALLCCLISTIALWEFYDMLEKGGLKCSKLMGLGGGLLLAAGTWWFSARRSDLTNTFEILVLVGMVLLLFIHELIRDDNPDPIQTIGNTVLGIVYVPWLFCFFAKIKYLYGSNANDGPGWLLCFYLVVVTKFCDIGAYSIGRLFGRHKFHPRVSPNKTWEGLLGGLVIAVIASVTAFKYIESRIAVSHFHYSDALIAGLFLAVLGVAGDLSESLFKRETKVKDSGGVLPGIGGALDLVDSLLFTAPAFYGYLVLLNWIR